uniref:FCH domain-containing protein n=1 Tax=Macrostomum lignano TaxID=282301 RepID=A0A1I8FKI2_9PLAT
TAVIIKAQLLSAACPCSAASAAGDHAADLALPDSASNSSPDDAARDCTTASNDAGAFNRSGGPASGHSQEPRRAVSIIARCAAAILVRHQNSGCWNCWAALSCLRRHARSSSGRIFDSSARESGERRRWETLMTCFRRPEGASGRTVQLWSSWSAAPGSSICCRMGNDERSFGQRLCLQAEFRGIKYLGISIHASRPRMARAAASRGESCTRPWTGSRRAEDEPLKCHAGAARASPKPGGRLRHPAGGKERAVQQMQHSLRAGPVTAPCANEKRSWSRRRSAGGQICHSPSAPAAPAAANSSKYFSSSNGAGGGIPPAKLPGVNCPAAPPPTPRTPPTTTAALVSAASATPAASAVRRCSCRPGGMQRPPAGDPEAPPAAAELDGPYRRLAAAASVMDMNDERGRRRIDVDDFEDNLSCRPTAGQRQGRRSRHRSRLEDQEGAATLLASTTRWFGHIVATNSPRVVGVDALSEQDQLLPWPCAAFPCWSGSCRPALCRRQFERELFRRRAAPSCCCCLPSMTLEKSVKFKTSLQQLSQGDQSNRLRDFLQANSDRVERLKTDLKTAEECYSLVKTRFGEGNATGGQRCVLQHPAPLPLPDVTRLRSENEQRRAAAAELNELLARSGPAAPHPRKHTRTIEDGALDDIMSDFSRALTCGRRSSTGSARLRAIDCARSGVAPGRRRRGRRPLLLPSPLDRRLAKEQRLSRVSCCLNTT